MPAGADTVFMQEDVRTEGDAVIVPAGLKPGANRRLAGEDVRKGSVVLPAGRRLAVPDVTLAAAVGLTTLDVRRRVRVALFSTGDEIVEPGNPRPAAALFDANRTLLDGMLDRLGASVTDLGILKDDAAALEKAIATAARDHDLVLTSGGVSTGEADHVRTAVEKVGRLVSGASPSSRAGRWRLGVIRGAAAGDGVAFVGLPGNPVAAFVTFARVVRPLFLRLAGANPEPLTALPVRLAFAYKKKTGRREYVRVALRSCPDGNHRGGQASAGGRGCHHFAHRDRWARRTLRRHDDGRAGLDRRISVVCNADGLDSDARLRRERLVNRLVDSVEHDGSTDGDHGERDAGGKKGLHGEPPKLVCLRLAI